MSVERSALNVERSASAVDADSPWPGLAPFTEDQNGFFHGRDAEIRALARLMERKALTVLFGQSGLGKSSLLMAGVFPRLRATHFCPIYLRLDHGDGALSPSEQVKALVADATARAGTWTKPGVAKPGETLWEFFHHRDDWLVDASGRTIVPVLVFDQFEELFTLGAARSTSSGSETARSTGSGSSTGAQRERAVAFMSELAELVENRPSEQLVARLEHSADEMDAFDFSRTDYRVCIALREDYLPHLEGLKTIMPALMENRMRLARMTGVQALEAVVKPGGALVTPEVAQAIVEFVSGARGGSAERLAELDVEPPLLSVICRELNERRRALGQAQISADLVSGNRREILTDFYERSVADLPDGMRTFVEDHLLTKSGFRDNLALETALEFPGVTRPLIDTLVSRRLLRIEDRLGVQRVELTHDVLAEVIRASRDARQQRLALATAAWHTRRQRWVIAGLGAAVVALSIGVFFGLRAQRLATRRASQQDLVLASRLLDEGKIADGLAYLVSAARKDPENPVIAPRLLSTLVSRNFLLPEGKPLVMPSPVAWAVWPSGGRRIFVQGEDKILRTINADTWQIEHEFQFAGKVVHWGTPEKNPDLCAALLDDNSIAVGDATTGRLKIPALHPPNNAPLIRVRVSPDGRWIAAHGGDTVWIWDSNTGELRTTLPHQSRNSRQQWGYPMSPDGGRISTLKSVDVYQIWSLPEGKPIGQEFRGTTGTGARPQYATFSPDGRLLAINYGRGAQIYDATTGAPQGPFIDGADQFGGSVKFTPDSRRLVVVVDLKASIIDVASGNPVFPPLFVSNQQTWDRGFSNDGRILYTAGVDGLVRLWDMETGTLLTEPTIQQESEVIAAVAPDGSQVALFTSAGPAYRLRVGRTAARPLQWSNQSAINTVFARDSPTRIIRYLRDRAELIDGTSGRTVEGGFSYPQPTTGPERLRVSTSTGLPTMVARVGSDALHGWASDAQGALHDVALDGMPPVSGVVRVVFDWTGEFAAMSGNANEEWFGVWNLRTGGAGSIIKHAKLIRGTSIQLSPRAQRAAFITEDLVGHVSDVATGKELFELEKPPGRWSGVEGFLFSSDGRQIVGQHGSGTVNFWNAFDGRLIASRRGHRTSSMAWLRYGSFSRDGRFYASVSADATAQVWDLTTRTAVGEPLVHDREVFTAVFDSNSSRVVTASADGTARVWDTLTGQPLTAPMRHNNPVASAEFSPDGRFVMTSVTTTGAQATYLWAVPAHSGGASAPEWLLRLATICASKRVNEEGKLIPALDDIGRFEEIRHELAALPDDAPFVEWGRWFLSNDAKRSIAPGFTITPAEAKELAAPDPLPEMTARDTALKEQGKFAEAEPLEREMLAWVLKRDGEGSGSIAGRRIALAGTLLRLGKFAEAESLARSSLAIREKINAPDSFNVASARGVIGSALVGQKRYAEAEPLLVEACDTLKRLHSTGAVGAAAQPRFKEHITSLVQLYAATGRPEKAAEWRKFLATIPDQAPPAPAR